MREQFELDEGVVYLDAASITPRAKVVVNAAHQGIAHYQRPWMKRGWDKEALAQRVRSSAALAVGADPLHVALVSAVSYGMATAAANLAIAKGSRILALEDDHPSAALIWARLAIERGAIFETVPRPVDGDWTSAVRTRLDQAGAISVAVLSPVHWTDGSLVDIAQLAPLVRSRGAALVIDATQAAGVMDIDAPALDADFIAFPSYKWLMGPYGLAYLYVHPRHHAGLPLEEHMGARKAPALKEAGSPGDFSHKPGAERFDRGERDDYLALTTAAEGLTLSASVNRAQKREMLWALNDRLCVAIGSMDIAVAPRHLRAPHIIGLRLRTDSASRVADALEQRRVYVSARRGVLRVAPYLYNNDADVDRFVDALREVIGRR
jgi:selenocysteine lyase/cysteine desulfurase